MPYRKFDDIPILTQIIVFLIGVWGGIVNYTKRAELKRELTLKKKIYYFILDAISSSGIAVITFLGLVGWGFNELFATAVAGVMAYQGTRAIYIFELYLAEKLKSKTLEEDAKKGLK